MTPTLQISFGRPGSWTDIDKVERWDWDKTRAFFSKVPPISDSKEAKGWYTTATFTDNYRHDDNLKTRTAILWDQDRDGDAARAAIVAALKRSNIAYVAYATHSSVPGQARTRFVIPSDREMSGEEYECVSRVLAANLDILHLLAKESHVPTQMMFMPLRKPGGEIWSDAAGKLPVHVDATLADLPDWTIREYWPRVANDSVSDPDADRVDPREIHGIVGAFCRAYDIPTAIDKFELPYEPTSNPTRYTYTAGSRPEGAVLYDEGTKLHSHHDTDPAHGQHNAFDLVRLHRHGGVRSALVEHLESDRVVMAELLGDGDAFEPIPPEPSEVEQLFDALDNSRAGVSESTPAGANPFRIETADQYLTAKPQEWLIKHVLPRADTIMIYGESGAGKTFIAMDMLAAINRGIPWRGKKTKKLKTVLLAAEGSGGARMRLKAYRMFNEGVSNGDLPALIDASPDLRDPAQVAQLASSLKKYSPAGGVLMIDTLAASMPGGDENSGKDMGLILGHCKQISTLAKFTVILIHHSGKDVAKGARGWSGLKGNVDAQMCVTRNGDARSIDCTKQKDGDDGAQFGFKLRVVEVGRDEDGEAVTSCVCEPVVSADRVETKVVIDKAPKLPLLEAAIYQSLEFASLPMLVSEVVSEFAAKDHTSDSNKATEAIKKAITNLGLRGLIRVGGREIVSTSHTDSS